MATAIIEKIIRASVSASGKFEVYLPDGTVMYFTRKQKMRNFVLNQKNNPALREAFRDILQRDPNLTNTDNVIRWRYTTRSALREVL